MKHYIITVLFGLSMVSSPAQADYRHYHSGSGGEVLLPLIIGGVVGAAIANSNRPEPIVIQQQIVQPPPVYVQPSQGFVQCPAGTMPFEQRGWVSNQWGQWVQVYYIECK